MHILNGTVDFWVARQSWDETVARFVHIEEFMTPAPYYENPKVLTDLYDIEAGTHLKHPPGSAENISDQVPENQKTPSSYFS